MNTHTCLSTRRKSALPRLLAAMLLAFFVMSMFVIEDVAAETNGSVTGVVTNGSTNAPAPGVEVTLSRFEEVGPESVDLVAMTDADGRFVFKNLDSSRGYVYAASTRYHRVLYSSGMILLSQEPQQEIQLLIHETTDQDSVVQMLARGIVISGVDVSEGIVAITDLSVISNTTDRTYVGDEDGRTIRFGVPGNAIQVTPRGGFDFTNAMIEDATVFTISPLRPGTVNATMDYTVPYTGRAVRFPIQSRYTTGVVRILVPVTDAFADVAVTAEDIELSDEGVVEIEGSPYHVWTLADVPAGSTLNVSVTNLPATEIVHNELKTVAPTIVALSVLAIAACITGGVVVRRGLHRERPVVLPPPVAASLDERRAELSEQLRALEAQWLAGDVEENEYRSTRRLILEDLRKISRQYRGLGDDE